MVVFVQQEIVTAVMTNMNGLSSKEKQPDIAGIVIVFSMECLKIGEGAGVYFAIKNSQDGA